MLATMTMKFGSDFESAARVVAQADLTGHVRTRILLGPDPVAIVVAELAIIHGIAFDLGMLISVISDPESTPEEQRTLVLLNGTKDQTVAFNEAMAEARAR